MLVHLERSRAEMLDFHAVLDQRLMHRIGQRDTANHLARQFARMGSRK